MELNKKNRTELKSYFLANKIPTQKNFEEFIEAGLNQAEDGVVKLQGRPLSIQAEGDQSGTQELLHFYKNFNDNNPGWSINQNPRLVAGDPSTNKPGLNINDSSGASRLFIKSTGGNIGMGTIEPESRLHIKDKRAELRLQNTDPNEWSLVNLRGTANNFWDIAQKGDSDRLEFRPNGGDANRLIMKNDGSFQAAGGVLVDGNRTTHLETDGALYRMNGQVYLTVDDNLYIRDQAGEPKIHMDTNNGRIGIGKVNPTVGLDVAGDVRATSLFGEGSSKIEWVLGFANAAASSGTWIPTAGWGEPKFSASCSYTQTEVFNQLGTESLDFNIPAGAKTAYLSALAWGNTCYFDIFLNIGGAWKFNRRINQFNNVSNESTAGQHDGNYVTMAATGIDHATMIRIQNRRGRIHFTGMGFSRQDMSGSYDPGFVHQDNIASPHIIRGMIMMWSGITAPAGWGLCDGTQGTPDLRGRFVLGFGAGTGLTNRLINQFGGAEVHALNVNELPSHNHAIGTYQDDYNVAGGGSGRPSWGNDNGAWGNYHFTVGTGGNGSHNNMPPYFVLAYIMKL